MTNISTFGSVEPMRIYAFDIWIARIPKQENSHVQYGSRPVVVVSNDQINASGPVVTVVPLTARRNKTSMRSHVYLSAVQKGRNGWIAIALPCVIMSKP